MQRLPNAECVNVFFPPHFPLGPWPKQQWTQQTCSASDYTFHKCPPTFKVAIAHWPYQIKIHKGNWCCSLPSSWYTVCRRPLVILRFLTEFFVVDFPLGFCYNWIFLCVWKVAITVCFESKRFLLIIEGLKSFSFWAQLWFHVINTRHPSTISHFLSATSFLAHIRSPTEEHLILCSQSTNNVITPPPYPRHRHQRIVQRKTFSLFAIHNQLRHYTPTPPPIDTNESST